MIGVGIMYLMFLVFLCFRDWKVIFIYLFLLLKVGFLELLVLMVVLICDLIMKVVKLRIVFYKVYERIIKL